MDYRNQIKSYLQTEMEVMKTLDVEVINEITNIIRDTQEKGHNIYICGNGGSAATASHYVCDFNKSVAMEYGKDTGFICLSDNTPILTAIANDISYDEVFSFQLEKQIKPGDILFVISGSGNSKNIVRAMEVAKAKGNKIVGLCGYDGGKVKQMSDVCLHVNINNMQVVEDLHMVLDHCMMYILTYGRGKC